METVKHILGQPETIQGVGEIHPIKLKDYDKFMQYAGILQISKNHIPEEFKDYSLFNYLMLNGLQDSDLMINLEKLFLLLTNKEFKFITDGKQHGFITDDEQHVIVEQNYEQLRKTVMKQNLIFEQKIFKDELTREWAELVIKKRQKDSVKMTIEDMISTVQVMSGVTYKELSEFTLYELYSSFNRINKVKSYETNVSFKCAGAEKINLDHFAEDLNLFKNPYDDIFVGKDKLSKLNSVFGGQG